MGLQLNIINNSTIKHKSEMGPSGSTVHVYAVSIALFVFFDLSLSFRNYSSRLVPHWKGRIAKAKWQMMISLVRGEDEK